MTTGDDETRTTGDSGATTTDDGEADGVARPRAPGAGCEGAEAFRLTRAAAAGG